MDRRFIYQTVFGCAHGVSPRDWVWRWGHMLLLAATAIVAAGSSSAAEVSVELELVGAMSSRNQAAWWSPIVYRDGEVYVSYLSPNSPHDDVYVAKRGAPNTWTLHDTLLNSVYDVGHTQTSLAMDGDGHLHLFYGMHGHPMRYAQSNEPGSIADGFAAMAPAAFNGGAYTYPNVTTAPNGDLYLIIRDRRSAYVNSGQDGRLYRFDNATRTWSTLPPFAGQVGTTVYPDHVYADDAGQVHIVWEWAAGGPQGGRHFGSYARFDPESNAYYRADGSAYASSPISVAQSDVYQGLEGSETFAFGVHGVQSAKMTLDDQKRPIVAYGYSLTGTESGYEHRLARWTGTEWIQSTVTPGPFDIDKSWVALSDGVLRYYGTLSPTDSAHTGSDDIFVRLSYDYGESWTAPIAVTSGLDIQRPVGVTGDGVDYLYLPSVTGQQLHVAVVAFDTSTATPGDFNGDGAVDGADFVIWQTNFPTEKGATREQGDANGDGAVDGADFVVWQTHFPTHTAMETVPVPEPASILGAAVCAALAAGYRGIRPRRMRNHATKAIRGM